MKKQEFVITNGVLKEYNGRDSVVTIPQGVSEIGDRAFSCSGVETLNIPSSVKIIGTDAFYFCYGMKSIIIPQSVTEIKDHAFWQSGIKEVLIESDDISISKSAFGRCRRLADKNGFVILRGTLYGYYGNKSELVLPDGILNIGDRAFEESRNLKKITLPNGLISISREAFYYNNELTEIRLPDSVKHIGKQAFGFCKKLESVCGGADDIVVDTLAFDTCPKLTHVNLMNSAIVSYDAFQSCEKLQSSIVYKTMKLNDGVIEWMSLSCDTMCIPTYVDTVCGLSGVTCDKLVIPEHVKKVYSIGNINAKCVEIKMNMKEIGYRFFADSISLEKVVLPDTVNRIEGEAFSGCINLKEIQLPNDIEYIGDNAFINCLNIDVLIIPSKINDLGHICGTKSTVPIIAPHIKFKEIKAGYKVALLRGFARSIEYNIEYSREETNSYISYMKRNRKKLIDEQNDEILLNMLKAL